MTQHGRFLVAGIVLWLIAVDCLHGSVLVTTVGSW